MKTLVVNLISGPGSGKSVTAALLFAELKLQTSLSVELVQEVAKTLVWQQRFDELDNQYSVTHTQYKTLKSMKGKVRVIVTDGSLINAAYYNRHNPYNVCDRDKVERKILEWFGEFENMNIFLRRGDWPYEQAGRQQTLEQSIEIDSWLKRWMNENEIEYAEVDTSREAVHKIIRDLLEENLA